MLKLFRRQSRRPFFAHYAAGKKNNWAPVGAAGRVQRGRGARVGKLPAGWGRRGRGGEAACLSGGKGGGGEGVVVGLVARQGSQLAAAAGRGSSWKSEEGRGGEGEGWQGVQSKIKTITNETNIEWFKSQWWVLRA